MGGGLIQELENAFDTLEKEFEGGKGKAVYPKSFKGDVLGKHDPYGEDTGDHEAHASESEVADPSKDAEWFPAIKKAGSGKEGNKPVPAPWAADAAAGGKGSNGSQDSAGNPGGGGAAGGGGGGAGANAAAGGNGGNGSQDSAGNAGGGGGGGAGANAVAGSNGSNGSQDSAGNAGGGGAAGGAGAAAAAGGNGSKGSQDSAGNAGGGGAAGGGAGANAAAGSNGSKGSQGPTAVDQAGVLAAEQSQNIEAERAHQKIPSLKRDLEKTVAQAKEAKLRKEELRGVRRTLEKPHKLFKDPERLAAARSGDETRIRQSLKRHGRSVEPKDDSDAEDISASPKKLKEVRHNPNKAIRCMLDMGQQYGKHPFDGVDPADVQEIMEHHAAEHPHRKHKAPYVTPKSLNDTEGDDSLDDRDEDESARASSGDGSGSDDDGYDASQANDSDDGDSEPPTYPKIDDAARLDPDNPTHTRTFRKKDGKKRRAYPKPYTDPNNPSDLQLACESLAEMAKANGSDSQDDDQGNNDSDEDTSLKAQRARAARKMLKCLNRVRSFQQDPLACEGAFVDEAAEDGSTVSGLTPHEIESRYYALKQISLSRASRDDDATDDDGDEDATDTQNDGGNKTPSKYTATHQADAEEDDGGDEEDDDDDTDSASPNANVIFNNGSAADDESEIDDIDVALPQNQFRNMTVRGSSAGSDDSDDDSDDSDSTSSDSSDDDSDDSDSTSSDSGDDDSDDSDSTSSDSGDDDSDDSDSISSDSSDDDSDDSGSSSSGSSDDSSDTTSTDSGGSNVAGGALSAASSLAQSFLPSGAASAVAGAVGDIQSAVQAVQGVKDAISQVEGSLSDVENAGSQAKSVLSAFKSGGVGGAAKALSGVFNLCANPMDAITKGENLLSSVGNLAQHPDKIISKANSLIQAGVQGVSAIASAKSPAGALNGVLNLTNQATAAIDSGAQQVSSATSSDSDGSGDGSGGG